MPRSTRWPLAPRGLRGCTVQKKKKKHVVQGRPLMKLRPQARHQGPNQGCWPSNDMFSSASEGNVPKPTSRNRCGCAACRRFPPLLCPGHYRPTVLDFEIASAQGPRTTFPNALPTPPRGRVLYTAGGLFLYTAGGLFVEACGKISTGCCTRRGWAVNKKIAMF